MIQNSSFTFHNIISGEASIGRLRVCCYFAYTDGWLQVDLGQKYRLYAVANHGHQWSTEDYITTEFKVRYGLTSDSLTTYTEDGEEKAFIGNTLENIRDIIKRTFLHPFVAQFVRFVITNGNYRPVIAMEFYGCKIFSDTATTYVKFNNGSDIFQAMPELSDANLSTEVLLTRNDNQKKFIFSLSHQVNTADVDINVKIRLNSNCQLSDILPYLYVHQYGDLAELTSAAYKMCTLNSVDSNDDPLHTSSYSCHCDYGLCEHAILQVFTRRDEQCASLVELEIAS